MSTIRLTVLPAKVLKDGRHKIRVAVCHKQETAYIPTNIVIDSVSEFRRGQVVKRPDASYLNTKLRGILDAYQSELDKIQMQDLYSATQLRNMILGKDLSGTCLEDICKDLCEQLRVDKRDSYANLLEYAAKNYVAFIGEKFPIKGLTPKMISDFRNYLTGNTQMSDITKDATLGRVRTLINNAISAHKVSYEVHPFSEIRLHAQKVREVDVSLDTIAMIRDYSSDVRKKQLGRDVFMLSFYMGGMNFADLIKVDFRQDVCSYCRTKTRNMGNVRQITKFTIPEEAKTIASKYQLPSGLINTGYHFKTYHGLIAYIGEAIQEMARELQLKERVVFYSARKTFAQTAFELGVSEMIIDYLLGHSPASHGIIRYYAKARQSQADEAIRTVIDELSRYPLCPNG